MKSSEKKAIEIMQRAFSDHDLELYVFTIQDYFADETDQLEIDNPEMEDYLNDVIPEFTEGFDLTKKEEWLQQLQVIIDNAKSMVTREES